MKGLWSEARKVTRGERDQRRTSEEASDSFSFEDCREGIEGVLVIVLGTDRQCWRVGLSESRPNKNRVIS